MCLSALVFTSVAGASTPPNQAEKKPVVATLPFGVFGSLEFKTNATAGIGQWQHVQGLVASEQKLYRQCDSGAAACPSYLAIWRKNLKSWSAESSAKQLSLVNAWVNQQIRYTDDNAVYHRADYWASPAQSLKGRGDCEDYAIAKYASLKALGFGDDRLRIIIVNDTRKNLGHAVLSVRTAQGIYILDNQNPRPMLHQQISYYAPVSSFNANGRWINIATRQITTQYANAMEKGSDPVLAIKPVKLDVVATGEVPQAGPELRPSFAEAELEALHAHPALFEDDRR